MSQSNSIDEHAIELIARRVANALKDQLVEIAAGLGERSVTESTLTVDDVAERFSVSRSTVYAHWREWGGFKLGAGDKSAIRFRPSSLPTRQSKASQPVRTSNARPSRSRRARRASVVLRGEPRLPTEFDGDLTVLGRAAKDRVDLASPFDAADA